MKKVLVVILIVVGAIVIKIPEYVELNDLAIIESMGVSYKNAIYNVYLKEVIPKKDENGINYEYKYYESQAEDIDDAIDKMQQKMKKKLYLKKVKLLITDLEKSKSLIEKLKIKPVNIIHTKKDIFKEVKRINT